MKKVQNIFLLVFTAVMLSGVYTSCKKNDLPNNGQPRITYIRITAPESSDSLLVGAGQGRLIAIMGENLDKAVEIWFNDQKAVLTPTYITNTSILVSVPSRVPIDITNKIKIIFSDGRELLHNFTVQISKPSITSMVCEYVKTNDVATIRGDFFYAPITVTFTGGATGQITSLKDQEIQVMVPAGAQPGPITIKTNFGETVSDFWFRDDRN
ncbi:MAG TPA: IPT/TIG domain-containing protein, partial [Flavisolibacter sp.]|nr:IPT/TIG domain-containing protein [Flavisolibacter sp.]